MAKPEKVDKSEKARTTYYRIVPAVDAQGKPVPGGWNTEEITLEGVVIEKRIHEKAQPLSVARERYFALQAKFTKRERPESW